MITIDENNEMGMQEEIRKKKRFLIVLRFMYVCLQILACVALTATFIRLTDQFRLPFFFSLIPLLIYFLVGLERCYMEQDEQLNCLIRGSVTGFLSGFLGNVTNDYLSTNSHNVKSNSFISLCQLEFLYIPVVMGTVMYLFCLVFKKFPSLIITILSLALATCCMTIFSLSVIFFSSNPDNVVVNKTAAFLVFVFVFVFGIMPSVNSSRRVWFLLLLLFVLVITWQSNHLDLFQWDWQLARFPVSGSLTSLIILFLFDVSQKHNIDDVYSHFKKRKRLNSKCADFDLETFITSRDELIKVGDENEEEDEDKDLVSTSLTWHCLCYIVERTTLTLIIERQQKRNIPTDTWISCIIMMFVYIIHVNQKHLPLNSRILLVSLFLFLYFNLTISSGILSNAYLLEDVLALNFIILSMSPEVCS